MIKVYYDSDADPKALEGKTVAIIGYGIQGQHQALNLRDSKINVVVSDLEGSPGWKRAVADGFTPVAASEAAARGDLIQILTEDHVQARVYREQIAPQMKAGKALLFSHGFNIHYNQVVPPADVDVIMVAPKGPGSLVREMYVQGKGVPCLLAIHQDATGRAKQLGLAYAWGIGGTRAGVIETSFQEETETDLFGEQAVLCGGVSSLIKTGFEVLVEAGYTPEVAYFEVLHELKLIVDLIQARGINGMRVGVSNTACYGDITRGPRIIGEEVREAMWEILEEVQNGEFAREWILENQAGRPTFTRLMAQEREHEIEEVGAELRAMMPWLEK